MPNVIRIFVFHLGGITAILLFSLPGIGFNRTAALRHDKTCGIDPLWSLVFGRVTVTIRWNHQIWQPAFGDTLRIVLAFCRARSITLKHRRPDTMSLLFKT